MSDAAFIEALDAYVTLVQWLRAWALNRSDTRPSDEEVAAARARVLALYAERENDHLAALEQVALATIRMEQGRAERQGEEAVVTDGTPDGQYIELRFVQSTRITDGDRVWVTKVEEGQ